MKFFFLRHTSLKIAKDIFYGQTDIDVSDTFNDDVKIVKKKIASQKINLEKIQVFTSPLIRCHKLAKTLSKTVIVDERLKELNLGDWEMKKMDSIPKEQIKEWENNLLTFKVPNGETNNEFLFRLSLFLDNVILRNKDVFIIAHAGSINGMIAILTNKSFDQLIKKYWEKINYGSLSLVERVRERNILRFVGK